MNLDVHRKEFHLCIDGFNHWSPRLNLVSTSVVPQIHDGVAEVYAVTLVIAFFEQGIQLTTEGGGCRFNVDAGQSSDVEVVGERFRFPNRTRRGVRENGGGASNVGHVGAEFENHRFGIVGWIAVFNAP